MEKTYRVQWEIDVEAEDLISAIAKARFYLPCEHKAIESDMATVFSVTPDGGATEVIDLADLDPNAGDDCDVCHGSAKHTGEECPGCGRNEPE